MRARRRADPSRMADATAYCSVVPVRCDGRGSPIMRSAQRSTPKTCCASRRFEPKNDELADKAANLPPPWMTDRVAFMDDARLSPYERLVLHALVDHADAEGRCRPGYRRIAVATKINRSTVGFLVTGLEAKNRIEVENRSQAGNRYRILPFAPIAVVCNGAEEVSPVRVRRTPVAELHNRTGTRVA